MSGLSRGTINKSQGCLRLQVFSSPKSGQIGQNSGSDRLSVGRAGVGYNGDWMREVPFTACRQGPRIIITHF